MLKTAIPMTGFAAWLLIHPFLAAGEPQHPALRQRIDTAIESGVACLESLGRISSDQIWFLLRAQRKVRSPRLEQALEELNSRVGADGMLALLDASVEDDLTLPAGPPPWRQLMNLMRQSIACRNRTKPSAELDTFVYERHEGYVLTHQILAIEWARQVGCAIPPRWNTRAHELADQVRAEIEAEQTFTDLFAERVAVVGLVGKLNSKSDPWLQPILDAQNSDGCWRCPLKRTRMKFRGHTLLSQGDGGTPPAHTTALAIAALAFFREGSPQEIEVMEASSPGTGANWHRKRP